MKSNNKERHNKIRRIVSAVLLCAFILTNLGIPSYASETAKGSKLAVWAAHERGVARRARTKAYRKLFEEKLAPEYGGKCGWDIIVEKLAEKIGYNTPGSVRLAIREIWGEFIKANKAAVDKGNKLIQNDPKPDGKVSAKTINKLKTLIAQEFKFPLHLEKFMQARSEKLRGWIIDRSSGRYEDSYERNFARVFISPKREDEQFVVQGIKEIFKHAVGKIWIGENEKEKKTEGIPNLLNAEEGFGVLIQPFLNFGASGAAKSNLYGHTSIEAVIGDCDMAVKSIHANTVHFLFKKGEKSRFEYNPSFLNIPYQFRLKGKEYCVEEDPEEMKDVMEKYPKIMGKSSPLSKEEAIELNRVINALEEEIGVPLDVEWGFLDGKLYIIQIRPVIGDFKKPLVKIDTALEEKQKIAKTPIALGHTSPEGFTGKMVLFGKIGEETVSQFEKEFKVGYIRVQSDVAAGANEEGVARGLNTKAKVLVDVRQGSREAHNVNLITGRIASGEFVYANGPILREELEKNLDFMPHPTLKGVWVSKQDVTYFSDGLRGSFYMAGEKKAESKDKKLNERQKILLAFHNEVKDMMNPDGSVAFDFDSALFDIIKKTMYSGKMSDEQSCLIFEFIFGTTDALYAIEFGLFRKVYSETDLEIVQPKIELLEEALSYPLYPQAWESRCMERCKSLLVLKGIKIALEQKKKEHKEVTSDKYRVIFVDADNSKYSLKEVINNTLSGCEAISVPTRVMSTVRFELHKLNYDIPFFYIHLHGINLPSLIEVLTEIRKKNPKAKIFVDGLASNKEDFSVFEKQYGGINLITGWFGDEFLKQVITEDFRKWQDAQEQKHKPVEEKPKPEYPEKLRVLLIEDDTQCAEIVQNAFRNYLSDEYLLTIALDCNRAAEELHSGKYELVVCDVKFPNFSELKEGLEDTEHVVFSSAHNEGDAQKLIPEFLWQKSKYLEKPFFSDKLAACVKQIRKAQIEDYEEKLAEWQEAHPEAHKEEKTIEEARKFTAMFGDIRHMRRELTMELKKELPASSIRACHDLQHVLIAANNRKIDFLYLHAGVGMGIKTEFVLKILTEVRAKNPEAKIIVEGKAVKQEDYEAFEQKYGAVDFYINEFIDDEDLEKAIKKEHAKWQDAQPGAGRRDNFRVFIYDFEEIHKNLEEFFQTKSNCFVLRKTGKMETDPKTLEVVSEWRSFEDAVEENDYDADFIFIHLGNVLHATGAYDIGEKVMKKNPNAHILVEGRCIREKKYMSSIVEKSKGKVVVKGGLFSPSYVRKVAEKCYVEWQEAHQEEVKEDAAAEPKGKTMFVINDSPDEAKHLAELIRKKKADEYNVITMVSMRGLKRQLAKATPDLVITDTTIDKKDELENIMQLAAEKNPDTQFIITSEKAAIPRNEFKSKNVLGIVEKPFHAPRVIDVLDGTYENKIIAAKERFKIEEAGRIIKDVEKAHTVNRPGIIKVWSGYACPRLQKSMLTRIRKKTEDGPYKVEFCGINKLVNYACENAENENGVTILPHNRLTQNQRNRLDKANARVIYMDFEEDIMFEENDIVQIGGIVFTGVAYLNDNDNAFTNLYRLLTGDKSRSFITVREMRSYPYNFSFTLKPATIHDYSELKRLNRLMEEVLAAA